MNDPQAPSLLLQIASHAASVLTVVAFGPYLLATWRGALRPHVISWVIWFLTTTLVSFGQLADGAGVGAWPVLLSGILTGLVAVSAVRAAKRGQADTSVRPFEWSCLAAAVAAVPLWAITDHPLAAVLLLTAIDLIGFGPTISRIWRDPWSDSIAFFSIFGLRNFIVLLALERFTVTTAAFPLAIGIGCVVLIVLLIARRSRLSAPGHPPEEGLAPTHEPLGLTPAKSRPSR